MSLQSRRAARRVLAVASVGVAAGALLGCTQGESEGSREVRLQISSPSIEAQEYVRDQVAAFNESQADYSASVEFVPYDQLRQSLLQGAASGTLPDIVQASSTQSSLELLALGGWADMSDQMTDEWKESVGFSEGVFDELGGYGVPIFQVNEGVVYYDKAAFAAAGIEAPAVDEAWSWDEFREAAQALTTADRAGFADRAKGGFIIMKAALPYFLSYGTDIIHEVDGTWRSAFEEQPAQDAFRTYVELTTLDGVRPVSTVGWGLNEAINAWQTDQMAMLNIGDWFSVNLDGEFGTDWDAMLFPVADGTEPFTAAAQSYFHVTEQSDNRDGAWALINFLLEDERLAQFGYLDNRSIPSTDGAKAEPQWAEDTFLQDRISQWAGKGVYLPQEEHYIALWENVVGPALQEALQGNLSVDQAIDRLNAEINAELGVE